MRAQEFVAEAASPAQAWIDKVYAQYPDWPYGKGDKVMVWGSGENQQFAVFALKPALGKEPIVDVDWFQAVPQRQGVGTRAMKELQRQAQEDGIKLKLWPWDKGQIGQAGLKKFYKSTGFNPIGKGANSMQWEPTVDEGWRDVAAGVATAGALALGGGQAQATPIPQSNPSIQQQVAMSPIEKLKLAAHANGIKGTELAQFLAQCAHESANFTHMEEIGSPAYFAKKYDPKHAPKTAKILGNTEVGDGERYKGRGFIQLTGRDNYRRAGSALNLPLETNPQLAARPDIAALIAVWYWKNRVASKVKNFHNTKQVTHAINPAGKGLQSRQDQFKAYQVAQR